jgi:predicted aspartyl protease
MNQYFPHDSLFKRKLHSVWALIVFVIGLTAGSSHSFAQSTMAVEVVNDSIIVDVGLGEGRTARMLVDTGAQTTTFSRAAALRFKLPTTQPSDENSLFTGIGSFERLSIGALSTNSVPFGVLKLKNDVWEHIHSNHGAVDGSLGLDLLTRFVIGIDMPGATITIWQAGEFNQMQAQRWFDYLQVVPALTPGAAEAAVKASEIPQDAITHLSKPDMLDIWLPPQASLIIAGHAYRNVIQRSISPVTLTMDRGENDLYTIRGELDGFPFAFILDTGSNRLTLPPGFSSVLKPIVEMPGAQLSAIDTTESVMGCIYRSMKLGAYEVQYPYALASTGHSAYTRSPTLGMGLFSDCKLLIDFPGRTLSVARVAPNADAPRRKLATLGIFLIETEGKAHLYVGKGSPGERVGLHTGDGLVRCEGLPPAQPDAAISVRQIDEAKPVAVTVRRYGESETQTFTFEHDAEGEWSEPAPVATFPTLPGGYCGAKRFPRGGLYVDEDNLARLVKPGGSVLCDNGKFLVAYHDTRIRSFALDLPKDKFSIYPAQHEPGKPPVVANGKGLLWIGGVGWVIGPIGSRVELDGFTVALRPVPVGLPQAAVQ